MHANHSERAKYPKPVKRTVHTTPAVPANRAVQTKPAKPAKRAKRSMQVMQVEAFLRSSGGIARGAEIRERGGTRWAIDHAVETGRVMRPSRGWLALPDADPALLFAAQVGAVLSCITQAKRLGLWVHAEGELHVAARTPSSRPRCSTTVHWSQPIKHRPPGTLVDPIENVLGIVAQCRPQEEAVAIVESAVNRGLIDLPRLRALPYPPRVRQVIEMATPFSDSGLESYVKMRLRWLRLPVRAQTWLHGHRVDFLIGERLAFQIDGGHHVGKQRSEDIRHDAELALRGFHVIRVGYGDVMHRWPETQDLILSAISQGLHLVR